MSPSGELTVISEKMVREEAPVVSMSSNEAPSTAVEETLAAVCDMEYEVLQAPINLAQSKSRGEEIPTWQSPVEPVGAAQFFIREERAGSYEQIGSPSEVIQDLESVCSMEFKAPPAPISTMTPVQLIGRAERTETAEQLIILSGVMGEVIEGLENFCLLDGRSDPNVRRSPLPLWYPRRPLQDITAVLNIGPVVPEETSNVKKSSKKAQAVQPQAQRHDNRGGARGQQRVPRVPFKPASSVSAALKRSSLLRKGFR